MANDFVMLVRNNSCAKNERLFDRLGRVVHNLVGKDASTVLVKACAYYKKKSIIRWRVPMQSGKSVGYARYHSKTSK